MFTEGPEEAAEGDPRICRKEAEQRGARWDLKTRQ